MANVPLKSITFPGLSDTYTVPQIDNTLTTSGKAADAKVTGDQLNDLKSAADFSDNTLFNLVELPVSPNIGGITEENGIVVAGTSNSYRHFYVNVSEGESYAIKTYQKASTTYPYYIYLTDASDYINARYAPAPSVDRYYEYRVFIPSGVTRLYVMYKTNGSFVAEVKKYVTPYLKPSDADLRYMGLQHDESALNLELVIGGIQNSNGTLVNSESTSYRCVSIQCSKGEKYKAKVTQNHNSATSMTNYPYYGYVVDSELHILKAFLAVDTSISTGTVTVEETIEITDDDAAYLYVMALKDTTLDVWEYSPYWTNKINEIDDSISDLDAEINGEPTSEDLAEAGLAEASGHDATNTGLSFVFVTDTHSNGVFVTRGDPDVWTYGLDSKLSVSVFRHIAKTGTVDFGVHCGDVISAYNITKSDYLKTVAGYLQDYDSFRMPVLFVKGNHECNHEDNYYQTGEDITPTEYYNAFQRRDHSVKVVNPLDPFGGYYYCDFDEYKIRVIVLNAYIDPQTNGISNNFGEAQDTWFKNVALAMTGISDANKWGVIVLCHPSAATNNTIKTLRPQFFSQFCPATLIGYIHGHDTHTDGYTNEYGYNNIRVACGYAQTNQTGADRCCVDIFTLIPTVANDNSNGIIYETRIGRGESRAYNWGTTTGEITE